MANAIMNNALFSINIVCVVCGKEKDSSDFYFQRRQNRFSTMCKRCHNDKSSMYRRRKRIASGLHVGTNIIEARKLRMDHGKKKCPRCEVVKDLDLFSKTSVGTGVSDYCKACTKEAALKSRFGISLLDYNRLMEKQKGTCAICGKTPEQNQKMLAVDHDHKSGRIRGLLCSKCNLCIGYIDKNNMKIVSIFQYYKGLRSHSTGIGIAQDDLFVQPTPG